jgi:hypothetical protein
MGNGDHGDARILYLAKKNLGNFPFNQICKTIKPCVGALHTTLGLLEKLPAGLAEMALHESAATG